MKTGLTMNLREENIDNTDFLADDFTHQLLFGKIKFIISKL